MVIVFIFPSNRALHSFYVNFGVGDLLAEFNNKMAFTAVFN